MANQRSGLKIDRAKVKTRQKENQGSIEKYKQGRGEHEEVIGCGRDQNK